VVFGKRVSFPKMFTNRGKFGFWERVFLKKKKMFFLDFFGIFGFFWIFFGFFDFFFGIVKKCFSSKIWGRVFVFLCFISILFRFFFCLFLILFFVLFL